MEFGPILRSMKRSKVRYGLLVLEVALTLAIVTNCVGLILKARGEMAKPSGFDDENILSVRSVPFAPAFKEDPYVDEAIRKDLEALRALPGVRAATNSSFLPWQGGGSSTELRVAGSKRDMLRTQIYGTDDNTIATLGNEVVAGRNFTREDLVRETLLIRNLPPDRPRDENGRVKSPVAQQVVISKAFAKLAFDEEAPLGKQLEDSDGDRYTVIGVMDSFYNPYGWPIHEYAVFYASRSGGYSGMPYLIRVQPGQLKQVAAQVEKTLLTVNDGRNITLRTLPDVKAGYQGPQTFMVRLLSLVIVALLFVTSLGIVGLTSFSVAERTRQIGTRRALGARKLDILRYFLLENWLTTTMGLVLGAALTLGLNLALLKQADGARLDPVLLIAGVALLWVTGLAATFFPALRGARVAPAIATRSV